MSTPQHAINNAMSVFNALKASSHVILFGVRFEVVQEALVSPEQFDIDDLQYNAAIQYRTMENRLGERSLHETNYGFAMTSVENRVMTIYKDEQILPVEITWQ